MTLVVPESINKYRALAPAAAAPKKRSGYQTNQSSHGHHTRILIAHKIPALQSAFISFISLTSDKFLIFSASSTLLTIKFVLSREEFPGTFLRFTQSSGSRTFA